jgi:molybdate transport system regulatory protein
MANIAAERSYMSGKLNLKYKFWIETTDGESIMGEGKWKLLKAIHEHGSLQAAVSSMGYTYRQTWENLKNIEEKLGFKLLEKTRGGENGGQTTLTPKGLKMVAFFDHLYTEAEPAIRELNEALFDELDEITE